MLGRERDSLAAQGRDLISALTSGGGRGLTPAGRSSK